MIEDMQPEDDTRTLLDKEVKRQRGMMLLMTGIVVVALIALYFNPTLLDFLEPKEDPTPLANTDRGKTSGADPAKPEPAEAAPEKTSDPTKPRKFPPLQPIKTTTESVAIVSYPWRAYRNRGTLSGGYGDRPGILATLPQRGISKEDYLALEWKWQMPDDKAWMPELSFDLAYNICDHNDKLEAAYLNEAENVLPRLGTEVTWDAVARVAAALSTKHIIVIDFAIEQDLGERGITNKGGSGWRIWRWSNGVPTSGRGMPEATAWPEKNALLALRTDLSQHLSSIAHEAVTLGTMPASDEYGVMLAAMRISMENARFDDAVVKFQEIHKLYPTDDASIYALYHGTRDIKLRSWDDPDGTIERRRKLAHNFAINAMYDYVDKGGRAYRLRTMAAANKAYEAPGAVLLERQVYAYNMFQEVLRENPLFHEALNQSFDIPDFDQDGNPVEGDFFAHMAYAQRLHPNDARYLIKEAETLATNPATVDEAERKISRGLAMEPWLASGFMWRGMGWLIQANLMRAKQPLDRQTCEELYRNSYRAFHEGWSRNPSNVKIWFNLMLRALAFGRADEGVRYDKALNHPVVPAKDMSQLLPLYICAQVYVVLFKDDEVAFAKTVLKRIFGPEREAWFDSYLAKETKRVMEGRERAIDESEVFGKVDDEMILLGGVLQAVSAFGRDPKATPKAYVLKVIEAYRARGARCPELEVLIRPLIGD